MTVAERAPSRQTTAPPTAAKPHRSPSGPGTNGASG